MRTKKELDKYTMTSNDHNNNERTKIHIDRRKLKENQAKFQHNDDLRITILGTTNRLDFFNGVSTLYPK